MISRIRNLLARAEGAAPGRRAADELRLSAAALLVVAARMDGEFGDSERMTVRRLLEEKFDLSSEEAQELLEMAEAAAMRSTQLFHFTQTVKDGYVPDERIAMIEMLWEVAYADGTLHDYEANLLRRVAGLIHVPDAVSGSARKRVLSRLGIEA